MIKSSGKKMHGIRIIWDFLVSWLAVVAVSPLRLVDDKGMSWVFITLACQASFAKRGDSQSEQHGWLVWRRPVWLLRSHHQQDRDPYRVHQLQRRCFVDTYRVPQVMSDSEAGCVRTVWKENQRSWNETDLQIVSRYTGFLQKAEGSKWIHRGDYTDRHASITFSVDMSLCHSLPRSSAEPPIVAVLFCFLFILSAHSCRVNDFCAQRACNKLTKQLVLGWTECRETSEKALRPQVRKHGWTWLDSVLTSNIWPAGDISILKETPGSCKATPRCQAPKPNAQFWGFRMDCRSTKCTCWA